MGVGADLKTKLKTHLDELVTSGDLGQALETEFIKDYWQQAESNIETYPVGILAEPAIIESIPSTNGSNLRTYEFEIVVMLKGENVTLDDVENVMDAILNKIDNDPTLGGVACAGVEPTTTSPAPVSSQDKTFVMFSIFVRAKASISLTF